jgi:hypothetical protein
VLSIKWPNLPGVVPVKKLSKGLFVPKNSAKVALGSPWKV